MALTVSQSLTISHILESYEILEYYQILESYALVIGSIDQFDLVYSLVFIGTRALLR